MIIDAIYIKDLCSVWTIKHNNFIVIYQYRTISNGQNLKFHVNTKLVLDLYETKHSNWFYSYIN